MNKSELIEAVATKLEVTKAEAGRTVDAVLGTVIEGTVNDGNCVIPGLGKLTVVETAARSGVSQMGGESKPWTKAAGQTIKLRLSKSGKELV